MVRQSKLTKRHLRLLKALLQVIGELRDYEQKMQITTAQALIEVAIADCTSRGGPAKSNTGPLDITNVAEELSLNTSTASRIIKKLAAPMENGALLCKVTQNPDAYRGRISTVTPRGEALLRKLAALLDLPSAPDDQEDGC